jgi:hypothetical protein
MKKMSYILAALATIAVAAPTVASAEGSQSASGSPKPKMACMGSPRTQVGRMAVVFAMLASYGLSRTLTPNPLPIISMTPVLVIADRKTMMWGTLQRG